jgi:molecular chaperone DnaK
MAKRKTPALGIDLGTTFSVVARLDESGKPTTVVNSEGELLTPSVVLIEDDTAVVGKEAVKALGLDPDRVAQCAKREVGRDLFPQPLAGSHYPPEVLEAWILKKLRDDTALQVGPFKQVVITVPAYFDEVRRKATQDAGYMAGLELLDIINEPTAAAVAFGYQQGFFRPGASTRESQNLLVYDLGGGTFDVTVMQLRGANFITLATDGDVQLGGHDWDQRLVNFAAAEFEKRHGWDPRVDSAAKARLWRECEDLKRTLSARGRGGLTFDHRGKAMQLEVTREQFQELTLDLLERTRFTTVQTLAAAKLTWSEINRVLLVGGSTRMPMVIDLLRQLSGREPDRSVSADEAVAHGAALHAGFLLAKAAGKRPAFSIRNVNSHSLGVVARDPQTRRDRNATIIPRNTPLPAAARREFKTSTPGQESVLVRIVEGESASPEACSPIGRCVVRGLPAGLAAGTPIEVAFHYQADGRLTITVKISGTNHKLTHELTRACGLSDEQRDVWRQRIAGEEA